MRFFLAAGFLLILCGCKGAENVAPTVAQPPVATEDQPNPLRDHPLLNQAPNYAVTSQLGLLRKEQWLRIGDPVDRANDVFLQPRKATEFSDLPNNIGAGGYKAKGWTTTKESFGQIEYGGKIALAMIQEDKADEARLDSLVADYKSSLGPQDNYVGGKTTRFWFWTNNVKDPQQYLMITAVKPPKGEMRITVAVGDHAVMESLGMTPAHAITSKDRADQLYGGG